MQINKSKKVMKKAIVRLIREGHQLVWVCILPHTIKYAWMGGLEQAKKWAVEFNNK